MKKLLKIALSALLVTALTIGTTALAFGAPKTDSAVSSASSYAMYHRGQLRTVDSDMTDEEYKAALETYRSERRAQYAEDLKKDVADGNLTQEEADLLLKDFEEMADYCGNRMARTEGSYGRGGRMGRGFCH